MINNKPVKILHVLDVLTYNSGVASVVMNYVRHADPGRYVFDLAFHKPPDNTLVQEIKNRGGRVFTLPDIKPDSFIKYKKAFRNLIISENYPIVHGHIANAAFLFMAEAKKAGVLVRIIHSHNSESASEIWKRPRNAVLNSEAVRLSNKFFACSDKAADKLFHQSRARKKAVILPNGIDTQLYSYNPEARREIRRELGLSEKTFVMGHAGRFDLQKNHSFILRVFKAFNARFPDSVLMLAGNGEKMPEIKALAKNLNIINFIKFLGIRKDMSKIYQAFDLFVFPSVFEGFGLAGLEAQCSGLPCLFSDRVPKEISISEFTKYLPLDSPEAWAQSALKYTSGFVRRDASPEALQHGFDIKAQALYLQELYDLYLDQI